MKPPRQKKVYVFNEKWVLPLGLRVTNTYLDSRKVQTLGCRFFQEFWREKEDSAPKSRSLSTVKSWSGPLRTEHIKYHMMDQHSEKYSEYKELSYAEKEHILKWKLITRKLFVHTSTNATNASARLFSTNCR